MQFTPPKIPVLKPQPLPKHRLSKVGLLEAEVRRLKMELEDVKHKLPQHGRRSD